MPVVGMGGMVAGAGSSGITIKLSAIAAGAEGRGWAVDAVADLLVLRGLGLFAFSDVLERPMGANEKKRWKEEVTRDRW